MLVESVMHATTVGCSVLGLQSVLEETLEEHIYDAAVQLEE